MRDLDFGCAAALTSIPSYGTGATRTLKEAEGNLQKNAAAHHEMKLPLF
jgi:hypothetical protein